MIIGICGGSGSGKTTLLKRLCEHYAHLNPSVFSMDNYYFPIDQQQKDATGIYNFDLPTALDKDKLVEDLGRLATGNEILVKEYHFNSPPDKHVLLTIAPSQLIIVEGLFLFHYPEVSELLDYSIFINVDPKIQLDRRLYRDQETRGYTRDAILYQWENHVIPCYENYLLPYKDEADFQFRNDSNSEEDFQILTEKLSMKLEAQTQTF
ncbi:MAG: GTP-binding protein [Crocinitomicaceae bacterium]|nr:GTP-binding protein [Crocinitomicaceae bacterium]